MSHDRRFQTGAEGAGLSCRAARSWATASQLARSQRWAGSAGVCALSSRMTASSVARWSISRGVRIGPG